MQKISFWSRVILFSIFAISPIVGIPQVSNTYPGYDFYRDDVARPQIYRPQWEIRDYWRRVIPRCPRGQYWCGKYCADLRYDSANCGACFKSCPKGSFCMEGSCVDCKNECQPGESRCVDSGLVQVCERDKQSSCYRFSPPKTCGQGAVCEKELDRCVCRSECSVAGETRCQGRVIEVCHDADGNGCLEWSAYYECPQFAAYVTYCRDSECKLCANECREEGDRICEGEQGYRTCGQHDEDPCRDWSPPAICPEGQECEQGECCIHECEVGATQCLSATSQKTCGQYDQDACRDWSGPTQCGFGEHCENSTCQPCAVPDACITLGAEDCNGPDGAHRVCRDNDNDGCPQWVVEACTPGQQCNAGTGACEACSVPNGCATLGAEDCNGPDGAHRVCRDNDSDGCPQWVVDACTIGQQCNAGTGNCEACSVPDGCTTLGAEDCNGPDGAHRVCRDDDNDGCPQWAVEACTIGQQCNISTGNCEACTVPDACITLGAEDCNGPDGAHRVCRDDDNDGCPQWAVEACTIGQQCNAGTGNCEACSVPNGCTTLGAEDCNGPDGAHRVCRDNDGCPQWVVEACTPGQQCNTGTGNCEVCSVPNGCTTLGAEDCNGPGGAHRVCRDDDNDGCPQWVAEDCTIGQQCNAGTGNCEACSVPNSCTTLGAEDCNGPDGAHRVCRDDDNDGCPQWAVEACNPGFRCESNACEECPEVCTGGICAPDCDA